MQLKTLTKSEEYQSFLSTVTRNQWERIGTKRRAGVATPLFSIYSASSIGLGELPDLKLLVDWCQATGMSIIQLLPMNDVGFNFTPYDAQSTFALEPMYLSLNHLVEVPLGPIQNDIEALRKQFPAGGLRVNYKVKQAKLDLLWKMFLLARIQESESFHRFVDENRFWLDDYVLFKVIKEIKQETSWERWEHELREKDASVLKHLIHKYDSRIKFHQWLQWQLFEQFREVKRYAQIKKVLFMGDLPFLVSRDSADVWAHQNYFKLNLSSGAPPDMYFAKGQRWGMPPYDWLQIASHNYDYLKEKLKYAQNFYDLFRIDHVVGIFRVWTIALSESVESAGLHGVFDPSEESLWEEHGRKLLSVMVQNTSMLPCAEDLGVVPECSYRVLEEFGILGLDVQRWNKHWGKTYDFKAPAEYRKNSIAVVSSHDTSSMRGWWEFEAGTLDGMMFERLCQSKGIDYELVKDRLFDLQQSHYGRMRWKKEIKDESALLRILNIPQSEAFPFLDSYKGSYGEKEKFLNLLNAPLAGGEKFSPEVARHILEEVSKTASIFSIQLLQDWLSLDPDFECDAWNFRINFPGTFNDKNWTLAVPFSLERMLRLGINAEIKSINTRTGRI
jgi:4-alpha-glucanotransferase